MKIAFVLDDSLDRPDGVQQMVLTFGKWLSDNGHDVHYIVSDTQRTDLENIHSLGKVIRVQFNGNRMGTPLPTMLSAAKKVLRDIKPDVLHVQMPYSPLMAGQVIRAAGKKTAVVGSFHILPTGTASEAASRLLKLISIRSVRRFDAMVGVSKEAALFCKKVYGRSDGVVHNPVDLSIFETEKQLKNDTPHIVFLGRMVVRKGCEYLIEALGKLHAEDPDVKWTATIAGKGHMLVYLQKRAHQLRIASLVEFSGFVDEDYKPALLAGADIAVFPSTGGESFGIVLIEAMASGAGVVIGGDNPGYRTVLGNEPKTLVDPKDTDAFKELLKELIEKPSLRSRIHIVQQNEVKQYDVNVVGEKMLDVYRKAVASRQGH